MDPTLQAISKQTEIPVSEIPSPKARHPFHKTPIVLMSLFILLVIAAFFAGIYYQGMTASREAAKIASASPTPVAASPTPDIARNWLTYTSTSGFSFQYPPEYQIEKEGITNGKFTVSLKHKNYNDSKEAWGTSRAEVRKLDVSSQKLKGTLEEYIIQVFRLKVFKLGEFDGYELSKDPKDMTVFAIAEEKYGDNKWTHVIVPGIDDNFYYLLSPEGVLASTYNGYGAFIPSEVFDQILKTFKFTNTQQAVDTSDWKAQNISLYNLSLNLPRDWTISELKRRPEPTGPQDPKTGHDCAEYEIKNAKKTVSLSLVPTCGYSDGGALEAPGDAVSIKDLNGRSIIRFYDASLGKYIYADAGVASVSDEKGTRSVMMYSPILQFNEAKVYLFMRAVVLVESSGAQKQKDIENLDKIIASLKISSQ